MLQSARKPRAQALFAGVSLSLLAATTVAIRVVAAHHPAAKLPWTLTPTMLKDYRWFPISDFALVLGIILCFLAYRRGSHFVAAAAVLMSTALVYFDTLRVWTWEPSMLDLRVNATVLLSYVVQSVAAVALVAHAFIHFGRRQPG